MNLAYLGCMDWSRPQQRGLITTEAPSQRTKVKRYNHLAKYEAETIHAILDSPIAEFFHHCGMVCLNPKPLRGR
jgi:hypothetical protein